jgi:hypothetical protein
MPAPEGNKNAEKHIDWQLVDGLLEINCTGEEIATVIGVDYDTLASHCKDEKGMLFSEYIKKGNEQFKVSLKRMQYRSARGTSTANPDGTVRVIIPPSTTMQIWLGKQYLGQRERIEMGPEEDKPWVIKVVRGKQDADGE